MKSLELNFVGRRRWSSWTGLLILLVGLAGAATVALEYIQAQDELEVEQDRYSRLKRADKAASRPEKTLSTSSDEQKTAARVSVQLRQPWDELLRDLESISDSSVAILSIESQVQKRALRLLVEAKSTSAAISYANRLRNLSMVETAYLANHEQKIVGGVGVIRFSIDVSWKSPQ